MHRDQIKMENYGAVEEQLHTDSFSDLDLPLTIGFSDHVSLSDSSAQHCAIAQDDPHTEASLLHCFSLLSFFCSFLIT
jgi:hypothetical protein